MLRGIYDFFMNLSNEDEDEDEVIEVLIPPTLIGLQSQVASILEIDEDDNNHQLILSYARTRGVYVSHEAAKAYTFDQAKKLIDQVEKFTFDPVPDKFKVDKPTRKTF